MNVSHFIHINNALLECVYHMRIFLKTFINPNMSSKPRSFITDVTNSSKIMNRTYISEWLIGDWKLRNNGILSCEQPMFSCYSTTENPRNAIFDVMFWPNLPIIGYSHVYDLFIFFNKIFIYLIQYILYIWVSTFKIPIKPIPLLLCLDWNEWHCNHFHVTVSKSELFQIWRTKKAALISV